MGICDDIRAARRVGVVHCGIVPRTAATAAELAREFGLRDDPTCYREIDEAAARASVRRLLHRDLAYDAEVIPESQAARLTDRFFAPFGAGTRFFTDNACPATDATFDEGVLLLGPDRSGCFWVEDED
jgi:hypothetical protein